MADTVGTVKLHISADLDTLSAELRQKLGMLGPRLGREFSDKFSSSFSDSLSPAMVSAVRGAFNKAQRSLTTIHVKVVADLDLGATQAQLDRLGAESLKVTVNADADTAAARAKIDELGGDNKEVTVNVDADTLRAREKVHSLDEEAKKPQNKKIGIDTSSIEKALGSFNMLGLAGVASMGTILPVAVAATGAVLALGVAAAGVGAAFGVVALSFHGVGAAITALDNQESKAGETAAAAASAAISMANAQDSLKSAVQGVTDARYAAAQASEQASRRTADAEQAMSQAVSTAAQNTAAAERNLHQAQQEELQAQKDLTHAREDATRQLEDMQAKVADTALSERQAKLDLIQAQQDLDKVISNPRSTQLEIQQAILRRDEATQSADEAHTAAQRAVQDNTKAQKSGVEGSQQVVNAKQKIRDANGKVHQSEVDLTNTRADGARNVTKAQQDLADARRNEADVARKNAESIAKAEQGVIQAQRGIQSALIATQQVGSTTKNAVDEAMANLTPAGRKFARFIYSLKDDLTGLQNAAQSALLPPLQKAIELLLPYLPAVERFVGRMGAAVGGVALKIAQMLTGPAWRDFFNAVGRDAPGIISTLGDLFVHVGRVIGRALGAAAPFAKEMVTDITGFFKKIDDETGGASGKNKLKGIFDNIMPTLGAVWNVIQAIGRVLGSIVTNGTGTQGNAADTLNKIANAINKLATYIDNHPDVVGKLIGIAAGMVAIKTASPAIGAVGSLGNAIGGVAQVLKLVSWGAVFGAISGGIEAVAGAIGIAVAPFLAIIAVIAAVGGGLYLLYTKCTWFHNAVNAVIHKIADVFVWLWHSAIEPALHGIAKVLQWLYQNVVQPVWQLIWTAIKIAWGLIEVIFGTIEIALKILGKAWSWLYDHVIKPVWDAISGYISDKWNKYVRPVLDTIGNYIKTTVAPKLRTAIGIIKNIWNGLLEIFKAPIRFLIQTVLDDGLFAAYNWVAKKFDVKPDDVHVDVPAILQPAKRATGGGIFGPGSGTSDSIPALLSNGEHVWTAREVQAAGGHGAVQAIRQAVLNGAMPGYAWGGGVIDWVKNAAGKVGSGAGWAWNKAKDIGGAVKDFVTDPLGSLKKIATSALDHMPGGVNGLLGKLLVGIANKAVNGLASFAKGLLGFGGGGGSVSSSAVPNIGSGVERWRGLVSYWLGQEGLSLSLTDKVLRQIQTESGGNPNAVQGAGVIDVNSGVDPAKGILQTISATFRASHWPGTSWNIFDPSANIAAALNYARHRYGPDLSFLGLGHGYDSGGWLMPGTQIVHNNTGKPEAIFSPSQWATLEGQLLGGGGMDDYSKTTNIDVHAYGDPDAVAAAIAAEQGRADLLEAIGL